MSRTIRCSVQYDGTAFAGFQRQPHRETIQGALEAAIARVTQEPVTVVGAGRTDAGVHALGQVVHFHSHSPLPVGTLQRAINANLPDSVAVRDLQEAAPDFHARFDARSREYRYVVHADPLPSPLLRQRVYHLARELSVEAMTEATRPLEGTHDFRAFGSPMEHGSEDGRPFRGGTVRTMIAARCWTQQRFVLFGFIADAFLRHMVRMLVGTLLRVGSGRLAIDCVSRLLRGDATLTAGPAAPAHGLYLVRVRY